LRTAITVLVSTTGTGTCGTADVGAVVSTSLMDDAVITTSSRVIAIGARNESMIDKIESCVSLVVVFLVGNNVSVKLGIDTSVLSTMVSFVRCSSTFKGCDADGCATNGEGDVLDGRASAFFFFLGGIHFLRAIMIE
jgi:hypothetical protein